MKYRELLTESEVAKILKVSPRTVLQWRIDSKGPNYIKHQGTRLVRYPREELDRWLAGNVHSPATKRAKKKR